MRKRTAIVAVTVLGLACVVVGMLSTVALWERDALRAMRKAGL